MAAGFVICTLPMQALGSDAVSHGTQRALDECVLRVESQLGGSRCRERVGLLSQSSSGPGWPNMHCFYNGSSAADLPAWLITSA